VENLGLFPLGLVLVPGEQIPLHIFEPRYRELIGECLDNDSEFGLVLGDDQEIRLVGTTAAVVDVLVAKSVRALAVTGFATLVVAGGVGANQALRARLRDELSPRGAQVFFPEPRFCTDNGAMIALTGALRLAEGARDTGDAGRAPPYAFSVRPRWALQ